MIILSMKQSSLLLSYVEENYVASGLNDPEFAEKASKELGFVINTGHIRNRRIELGFNSNYVRPVKKEEEVKNHTLEERVNELESQVVILNNKLNKYFDLIDKKVYAHETHK